MKERCSYCPCPPDVPCANDNPLLCEWAATGDPLKLRHIVGKSRLIANMPVPKPASATSQPVLGGSQPRPGNLAREIVVSRYKEDLAWLNKAKDFVSIYDKGGLIEGKGHGLTILHAYTFQENRGREASSMLAHIIRHYDSLADWTYFVQGDGPTHDWHLLEKVNTTFESLTPICREFRRDYPTGGVKARDRVETIKGWEIRYGDVEAQGGWWNPLVWNYVFDCVKPSPLWFGYTAQWVVPRSNIIHREKEFYQWLLDESLAGEKERESVTNPPLNPWAMEAIWLYVFSDSVQYPHHKKWLSNRDRLQAAYAARHEAVRARLGGCGCGAKK